MQVSKKYTPSDSNFAEHQQSPPFNTMDAFDQSLNISEYWDQFFKQYYQPSDTVQVGGIAAPDLAVPAAEDSPQGRSLHISYLF